jgi:flagellar basal body-associated protein FliL
LAKIIVVVVLFLYCAYNFIFFFPFKNEGIAEKEKAVSERIKKGETVKWQQGSPESYIYYYLMRKKGVRVY